MKIIFENLSVFTIHLPYYNTWFREPRTRTIILQCFSWN